MGCSNSKDVKEPKLKTEVPEDVQAVECEVASPSPSAEVAVDAPEEVTEAVEVEAVTEAE